MEKQKTPAAGRPLLIFIAGMLILLVGMTLILLWWAALVIIFKGSIGFILAMAGLLMLYTLRQKV